MRRLFALILALALALPVVSTALAAPRGTLSISDPSPSWGETITVTAEVRHSPDPVVIWVRCSVDGTEVLSGGGRVGLIEVVTLESLAWQGGPGECVALLVATDGVHRKVLGSLDFHVSG